MPRRKTDYSTEAIQLMWKAGERTNEVMVNECDRIAKKLMRDQEKLKELIRNGDIGADAIDDPEVLVADLISIVMYLLHEEL